MRWDLHIRARLIKSAALLFVGAFFLAACPGQSYAGQNNCASWISHNSDCVNDNTCACVAAGTQLQITPPAMLPFAMPPGSNASTEVAPNPICQQITNSTTHDVVVPFRYINEWSLGEPYSFTARLPHGVTVTACGGAPVITFTANPTTINNGSSTTLTWLVTGSATSCTASGSGQFSGPVSPTGSSQLVSPLTTTTYGLSCTNSSGTTNASVTVTVDALAPGITFTANPSTIASGNPSTLTWTVTNSPASCTASGDASFNGPAGANGTASVSPTVTTTYELSCSNSGGTTNAWATVTVASPPGVTFTASPSTITKGSSTSLNWTVTAGSGTSCTASGDASFNGQVSPSGGTTSVAPTSTTTYGLSCSGPGGTTNVWTTVTVNGVCDYTNPNAVAVGVVTSYQENMWDDQANQCYFQNWNATYTVTGPPGAYQVFINPFIDSQMWYDCSSYQTFPPANTWQGGNALNWQQPPAGYTTYTVSPNSYSPTYNCDMCTNNVSDNINQQGDTLYFCP